jgi:hypothetical protein
MNVDEQKAAKGAALLEYTEAKERRTLLENETEKLAKHFESLAVLLRQRPAIVFGDADALLLKDYKRFAALVEDLKTTRTELQRLDGVVRGLGLSHFLNKN